MAAGVYLSEAQNPIPPPPLHTVYLYTEYFFTQGMRGGVEIEPEWKLRGNSSQSWVENANMTDIISSL
jgi:hypothetical protein